MTAAWKSLLASISFFCLVGVINIFSPRQAALASVQEEAEPKRSLVWYTTTTSEQAQALLRQFQTKPPSVKAEFYRAGGMALVLTEFHSCR